MILPVYTYGEELLTKKAEMVDLDDDTLPDIITNMYDTMRSTDLEMAINALLIGVSKQIFIIEGDIDDLFGGVFINPKILYSNEYLHQYAEPCLCFPSIKLNVKRPTIIEIEWFDEKKNHHKEYFNDMQAKIIQHQIDHLNGILITDRTTPEQLYKNRIKLDNIKKKIVCCKYEIYNPNK